MTYQIRTYYHETNLDFMICEGNTLQEVIKKFEPIQKNYNYYYIRRKE